MIAESILQHQDLLESLKQQNVQCIERTMEVDVCVSSWLCVLLEDLVPLSDGICYRVQTRLRAAAAKFEYCWIILQTKYVLVYGRETYKCFRSQTAGWIDTRSAQQWASTVVHAPIPTICRYSCNNTDIAILIRQAHEYALSEQPEVFLIQKYLTSASHPLCSLKNHHRKDFYVGSQPSTQLWHNNCWQYVGLTYHLLM